MNINNNKFFRIFINGNSNYQSININTNNLDSFQSGKKIYMCVEHFYMGKSDNVNYDAPLYLYTSNYQNNSVDTSTSLNSNHLLTIQNQNFTYFYNMDNSENGIICTLLSNLYIIFKKVSTQVGNLGELVDFDNINIGQYRLILRCYSID